jgi:hypothetical protein
LGWGLSYDRIAGSRTGCVKGKREEHEIEATVSQNVFKGGSIGNHERPDEQITKHAGQEKTFKRHHLAKKLDAVGWGLFFIWVGIAFLADLGMGVGLLGVGVITLGGRVARRYYNLNMEGFWVVVGFLVVVGGLWTIFEARVALVPLLLIVAGLAVLVSAFWGKARSEDDSCNQ